MAAIVGAQYCSDEELELVYKENCWSSDTVKDSSGRLLFKVKHPTFKSAGIRVTDPSSLPVVGIYYGKFFSLRSSWKVFPEPKSSDTPMLVFVKQSSVFQLNLSMHVFLGPNPNPDVEEPTYKIKRKAFGSSIKILRGREEELVAEANPSGFCCDYRYHITISAGVDHAFVLSLFLIVQEQDRIAAASASGGAAGAGGAAAAAAS